MVVDSHDTIRSKTVRKGAEVWAANFLIPMRVVPWDLRKSVRKQVKPTEQPATPLPMLHPDVRGDDKKDEKREKPAEKPSEEASEVRDEEAEEVIQYAQTHPHSDDEAEIPGGDSLRGGASSNVALPQPHGVKRDYMFNDHVWRVREVQPVDMALSKMMNQQSL